MSWLASVENQCFHDTVPAPLSHVATSSMSHGIHGQLGPGFSSVMTTSEPADPMAALCAEPLQGMDQQLIPTEGASPAVATMPLVSVAGNSNSNDHQQPIVASGRGKTSRKRGRSSGQMNSESRPASGRNAAKVPAMTSADDTPFPAPVNVLKSCAHTAWEWALLF